MKTKKKKDSHMSADVTQKNSVWLPFSSRFFLITVIFDVEIALLLPIPITILTTNIKLEMLITLVLLLIISSAYTMNETKDHSNEGTNKVTVINSNIWVSFKKCNLNS